MDRRLHKEGAVEIQVHRMEEGRSLLAVDNHLVVEPSGSLPEGGSRLEEDTRAAVGDSLVDRSRKPG